MLDLAITGAMICDGNGGLPYHASVGVEGGRIAEIGGQIGAARRTINADGLALMPGIIDTHTHFDAQVTWDPWLTPSPALGVTTAIIGNCGFTIAPCRPEHRDLSMRHLTHVEGMSLDVLRRGIRWDFESFPEYLASLERRGLGLNVATFFGHSSLRTFVMGEAATMRTATDGEIQAMRELLAAGMAAGAVGFASSTAEQHNGEGGTPMPSRLASPAEFEALVGVLGEERRGLFMLTKGSRTTIPFLESLAAASGRPVMIAALLHNPTNPDATFADLRAIAAAQARGRKLYGQVSCCPLTNDFTMASPYPFEGFAAWAPALRAEGADLCRIYADPDFRRRVKDELSAPARVRLFNGEWDKLHLLEAALPANQALEGRSVGELARAASKDPLDWLLDLAVAENLRTVFTAVLLNADEDAVGRMLRDPNACIALSDAGAHLTFFCDAGFGLHLLGHWVRERGTFTLAEAVHHLTARQAAIFGLQGRGQIAAGAAADLLLFDPASVGRGPKTRVFDLPGGAPRLVTPSAGVHGVWVNGVQVADGKGLAGNGTLPGQLLRGAAN
ncbi:MAG TPA: amidohydrolase family protein [Candidatus Cybelea sp.]|nr:amidohydrolase family protein [Candidatus Cybelea sp.]